MLDVTIFDPSPPSELGAMASTEAAFVGFADSWPLDFQVAVHDGKTEDLTPDSRPRIPPSSVATNIVDRNTSA